MRFANFETISALLAEAGKKILESHREIVAFDKGGELNSVVTEADVASERIILSGLRKLYPACRFLAEETAADINSPQDEEQLWIVDPLDGTTNFAFGLPLFCLTAAYAEKGVVQFAITYDPIRQETFWAERGGGAFCNGTRLSIRKETSIKGALLDVGCAYSHENFQKSESAWRIFHANGARLINLGTSALQCAYIAAGRLSGFCEAGLRPWDKAAGSLLVAEAGGVMESLDGGIFGTGLTFVGSAKLVSEMKALLNVV